MASDQQAADALGWYHTIDLPGGVVTNGYVDARRVADKVLPASLAGKRCLDIGTANGFWAFEMEKRGAAEVVALDLDDTRDLDWRPRCDLDDPSGEYLTSFDRERVFDAFQFAHAALDSRVERVAMPIYRAGRDELGAFDFVFLSSMLLHLRDPVLALSRMHDLCSDRTVIFDVVDPVLSLTRRSPTARFTAGAHPWWWVPNAAGLERMVWSVGFEVEERSKTMYIDQGPGFTRPPVLRAMRAGYSGLVGRFKGSPQVALTCRVHENARAGAADTRTAAS